MTASQANPGFGCLLQSGNGASTEVFTTFAEVVSISGFGQTQRTSEVTHMTSAAVEHIGLGLVEGKAFTVGLNFVADSTAQQALFQTKVAAGTTDNYRILFTDETGRQVTFAAIVQEVDINHERDSHAQMTVTFLPTDAFTYAAQA